MKVRYCADTDTLLIEFRDAPVDGTHGLDDYTVLDIDGDGNRLFATAHRGRWVARQGNW